MCDQDCLCAAWAAAEAALPEGGYITAFQRYNHPPLWEVHSWIPGSGEMAWGKGDSPADALRSLAARLSASPEKEPGK